MSLPLSPSIYCIALDSWWLVITDAARVTYSPSIQYLPLGLSGIVRCHIQANPDFQFITWTKDRRPFDPNANPGVVTLNNGSLLFQRVTNDHQGRYRCTPYNVHGTAGTSNPMEILVRGKEPCYRFDRGYESIFSEKFCSVFCTLYTVLEPEPYHSIFLPSFLIFFRCTNPSSYIFLSSLYSFFILHYPISHFINLSHPFIHPSFPFSLYSSLSFLDTMT